MPVDGEFLFFLLLGILLDDIQIDFHKKEHALGIRILILIRIEVIERRLDLPPLLLLNPLNFPLQQKLDNNLNTAFLRKHNKKPLTKKNGGLLHKARVEQIAALHHEIAERAQLNGQDVEVEELVHAAALVAEDVCQVFGVLFDAQVVFCEVFSFELFGGHFVRHLGHLYLCYRVIMVDFRFIFWMGYLISGVGNY